MGLCRKVACIEMFTQWMPPAIKNFISDSHRGQTSPEDPAKPLNSRLQVPLEPYDNCEAPCTARRLRLAAPFFKAWQHGMDSVTFGFSMKEIVQNAKFFMSLLNASLECCPTDLFFRRLPGILKDYHASVERTRPHTDYKPVIDCVKRMVGILLFAYSPVCLVCHVEIHEGWHWGHFFAKDFSIMDTSFKTKLETARRC